ncbi:MAG: exodeoxyribonuclease III, partial [Burkholderiales bacterium]
NGIRSAANKGFFAWLTKTRADVVCVQEVKAQAADMAPQLLSPNALREPGSRFQKRETKGVGRFPQTGANGANESSPRYLGFFQYADKKGYSGVGLYCKRQPDRVITGLGIPDIDAEGRYLQCDFGRLSVVSVYQPSGSSSEERQQVKFSFMQRFFPHLRKLAKSGREFILCGDWNIAHREIDLKNWRGNRKNSGFLPEERAWLTQVFDELGWVDVFRRVDSRPEQYTWWSNRGQAWTKNVGWRIDYQIATPGIAALAKKVSIYKERRFSDHAPLIIDYDLQS